MKILAVDTTSDRLGLALVGERGSVCRHRTAAGGHDEVLCRETDRLLKKAGWELKGLDLLVAASGPGSFTGVRVGMTFVGVLARILGRPALAVSLLEAAAVRAASRLDPERSGWIAVALPAPKEAAYFQLFRRGLSRPGSGPRLRSATEPLWIAACERTEKLGGLCRDMMRSRVGSKALSSSRGLGAMLLTGDASRQVVGDLQGVWKGRIEVWEGPPLDPGDLVAPARAKLEKGGEEDFSPLYLRQAYYERRAPVCNIRRTAT